MVSRTPEKTSQGVRSPASEVVGTPPRTGMIQRLSSSRLPPIVGGRTAAEAPPIVHEALRGPGASLDAATRKLMEERLGTDFSHVRVHTDDRAAESARAINALAYTVGGSIVFDRGRYAPHHGEGRSLLAHELVHTIQQRKTAPPLSGQRLTIDSLTSPAEDEARMIAASAASASLGDSNAAATGPQVALLRLSPRIQGWFTKKYNPPGQREYWYHKPLFSWNTEKFAYEGTNHEDITRGILAEPPWNKMFASTYRGIVVDASAEPDCCKGTEIARLLSKLVSKRSELEGLRASLGSEKVTAEQPKSPMELVLHGAEPRPAGITETVYRPSPSPVEFLVNEAARVFHSGKQRDTTERALRLLGTSLHMAQDFYAHNAALKQRDEAIECDKRLKGLLPTTGEYTGPSYILEDDPNLEPGRWKAANRVTHEQLDRFYYNGLMKEEDRAFLRKNP